MHLLVPGLSLYDPKMDSLGIIHSIPKARKRVSSWVSLFIRIENFSQEPLIRLSPYIPVDMIRMYTDVLVVRQARKVNIRPSCLCDGKWSLSTKKEEQG